MALGNDVYDVSENAPLLHLYDEANRRCMDTGSSPTSSGGSFRRGLALPATGGGMMTKSNLRSVAYFAIVGGVVCWLVAHLAPIRG